MSALRRFPEQVDVLVVGGGPAGTACALTLARLGKSVLVVERTRYGDWRPGETLAPVANAALEELGILGSLFAAGSKCCFGIEACWGSTQLYALDFIFDPYGLALQIERPCFDALLADAAATAGAWLSLDSRLVRVERQGGRWQTSVVAAGRQLQCRARFLVDASGCRASLARRLGARRIAVDRLIGLVGRSEPTGSRPAASTLLLEAVETGWWYTASVGGAHIVAFMTDADLLVTRGRVTIAGFQRLLANAPSTAARANIAASDLRPRAAASCWLREASGDGWLAVGDAAAAYDPLTGVGIAKALTSGLQAGRALAAALDGDSGATARFALEASNSHQLYMRQRAEIYARERRWPGSAFWARRHPGSEETSPVRAVDKARSRAS